MFLYNEYTNTYDRVIRVETHNWDDGETLRYLAVLHTLDVSEQHIRTNTETKYFKSPEERYEWLKENGVVE